MQENSGATARQIASDCRRLGVRRDGILLVHSSLRCLGKPEPDAVILGLLDALGPEGTLLLPALSYLHVDPSRPVFDERLTPSNVGALAEFFRTRPGTLRSLHPTHSACATGSRAAGMLARHHLDRTPCGANSPFRLLHYAGGQILMLGCGLHPNTSMHAIEELVEPPYLFSGGTTYTCERADGSRVEVTLRNHGFRGWNQRYDRIGGILSAPGLRTGTVLGADCHLIETHALWEAAHAALRRDPLFFVEPAGAAVAPPLRKPE
jgi:aminoglycoside 3-N-acetyltransferase